MPVTYTYPYIQYGGIWTTSQATDAVAAGTWAVPPTPHLLAWGGNSYGQLGTGNTTGYSSPKQIGSLVTWATVSSGYQQSAAIKTDGTLWTWGRNQQGQLGQGNTTNYSSPKQVGSLSNWSFVSAGEQFHMAAVKTDGTLWTWGYNFYGELGLGNTTYYSSPKQVGSLTNWLKVSASYSTLAIKTDGTLWGWGRNNFGQLGLGNTTNQSSPVQVGSLTNWSNVSSTYWATLAVKTDGTLWAWGNNSNGVLGLGNVTNYSSPKQVGALTNWVFVKTSDALFCGATKTDNTLWTWGQNDSGQLGLGNTTNYSSPKQVGSLTNWLYVACGQYSQYSIKTDGTLWSWGRGNSGQLGLGNTTNYSSPKQVGSLTTWIAISAEASSYSPLAIAKT